ncbi:uncharacterized protein K452DRAFT_15416 [Aplosporella prunicola CBS 121167]|uniref:Uncharacterized protein n=1 Tax=Aplosporella prunicola CBS 121167 TaxID=1176127 RepID=A0A6A6BG06_9PEZI|nr:uncharacterized protein K452DRAFT_15416 [Aplosporella prunicola CBS 121167]KAF2143082.1 hypothetical protein K452DRAFT_15416 [Aplosporella prunicola CBS 121167]
MRAWKEQSRRSKLATCLPRTHDGNAGPNFFEREIFLKGEIKVRNICGANIRACTWCMQTQTKRTLIQSIHARSRTLHVCSRTAERQTCTSIQGQGLEASVLLRLVEYTGTYATTGRALSTNWAIPPVASSSASRLDLITLSPPPPLPPRQSTHPHESIHAALQAAGDEVKMLYTHHRSYPLNSYATSQTSRAHKQPTQPQSTSA